VATLPCAGLVGQGGAPRGEISLEATAPKVTIAVPTASSTVSRKVQINGDVFHEKGVVKTELYADGKLVATGKDPTTFSLTWDSSKTKKGTHTLTVKAYDASGKIGSADVEVRIREEFDVKKYGAKGDGKADDTAAIWKALDAAKKAGGG